MDVYSDPVMSIGLYKVTASPLMILYETDILTGTPLAFVYKDLKHLMFALY